MDAFVKEMRVRFHEVDRAGIVFYPRFFDYFHMTFEDFFEAHTDAPYHVWTGRRGIGWPSVHVETDFRAPLHHGADFQVAMRIAKVGRTSFVCAYQGRSGETLCAEAAITVVTTDLERMVPLEIPTQVRQALARFAS